MSGGPDVRRAAELLRSALPFAPRVAVVLGSGLAQIVDELAEPTPVAFESLPGFSPAGVPGHQGRFVAGRLGGAEVIVQCGRYHLYEGHSPEVVGAPSRVLAELGASVVVLTNAAGGIREALEPGDLVMLEDHINLMSRSPLVGAAREGEIRFPDMSAPYDPALRRVALAAATELGLELQTGTYAGVLGPAFETAAEVRMLARLGADVVGMSTIPEVLVARARGVRCLAFSIVTNKATGLGRSPLSHEEVISVGLSAGERLTRLLRLLVPRLAPGVQSAAAK